jgi:hypothetical protein
LSQGTGGISRCVLNTVLPGLFDSKHRYDAVLEVYAPQASCMRQLLAAVLELAYLDQSAAVHVQGRVVMNWVATSSERTRTLQA